MQHLSLHLEEKIITLYFTITLFGQLQIRFLHNNATATEDQTNICKSNEHVTDC